MKYILILLLSITTINAFAGGFAPLETMTYQGVLTENGAPVNNTVNMTVRLYDGSTTPTIEWSENHSVNVVDGVFSLNLGQDVNLPVDLSGLWLELVVSGTPQLPRQPIRSVANAFTADNAFLLNGKQSSEFATESQYFLLLNIIDELQGQIDALKHKTQYISVEDSEMYITGANLNIRSGGGSTSATINGKGNLIVGYNENDSTQTRTGSHNLIIGNNNSYSSYGGFVAGWKNTLHGPHASISGGSYNFIAAASDAASISGGLLNHAAGENASVSGGRSNRATGDQSSVSGGRKNVASGQYSSISGGRNNTASGQYSSVLGGGFTGGSSDGNEAYANYSVVVGGYDNTTGDGADRTIGQSSAILSGRNNDTTGETAAVVGGLLNHGAGLRTVVSGGRENNASGDYASVSGGFMNDATGLRSVVSGGRDNRASGESASVSGGEDNLASGSSSSVSGGNNNQATGEISTVSGGNSNHALGFIATVSGGFQRLAAITWSWTAGSLSENQ